MCPSELKFDKLKVWARVANLPFNLQDDAWCKAIAKQIDKEASSIHFDHGGGYLRARVTLDVAKPLRRWILINSARRGSTDPYEIQYENIPHFCFSCGRLGHSDLVCPTPGTRDENGELPFGKGLLPSDEKKKAASSEGSSRTQPAKSNRNETRNSSNAATAEAEVNSPVKRKTAPKRKGGPPNQVYRRVELPLLTNHAANVEEGTEHTAIGTEKGDEGSEDEGTVREPKKKKPTPNNSSTSAEAAMQPCPAQ